MMDLNDFFATEVSDLPDNTLDDNIVSLIRRRRFQLLVHSHLYYRMNTNLVSDHTYDAWCRQLIELQASYPREAESAPFHKDFKDFSMGASFDLPLEQEWIYLQALRLLRYNKQTYQEEHYD